MDVTDAQWAVLEPLVPVDERHLQGPGRPFRPARDVFNGIVWILQTGARWQDLPERYPPYQTVYGRFSQWVNDGVFDRMLHALAKDVYNRGEIDLSECFIDGTFVVAKKGGHRWERPSGGKVRRSWQLQTALVFLSPSTLHLLHHMKSRLLKRLSPRVFLTLHPNT